MKWSKNLFSLDILAEGSCVPKNHKADQMIRFSENKKSFFGFNHPTDFDSILINHYYQID